MKQFRSFSRRPRRALSEIVSAVLLVSITILVSTIVLAFATSALGSSSLNFSNLVSGANNALDTHLSIEQVTFPKTALVSYIVITITNLQAQATPSPFQQQVTMNPSSYTSLEASDLGNIRFYSALSGSVFSSSLDSWLESVSSTPANTATSATFWLNLPNGIPANSKISVYLVFLSIATGFDGVVAGEAPELSPTFGQHDNGANVFSVYGGASWTGFSSEGGGSWVTTNGYLQQTASSGGGNQGGSSYVYTGSSFSSSGSYVIESMQSYPSVSFGSNPRVGLIAVSTPASGDNYGYRFIFEQSSNGAGALSFLNDEVAWVVNNGYQTSTNTNYLVSVSDNAGTWSGTLFQGNSVTSPSVTTLGSTSYSASNLQGNNAGYVGISAAVYTGSSTEANPVNVFWFRMRAFPPNGAMPSAASSPVQQISQSGANLYLRNLGKSQALISAIYVDNVSTSAVINSTQYSPPISINPGSFSVIRFQITTTFGTTYKFVVVSSTGQEAQVDAQA